MSCLGCCRQDEGTEPVVETLTCLKLPDLEVPEEAPEWEVNGEAKTSLEAKPLEPITASEPLQRSPQSFKDSLAKTDFEILRGITLRESLRWGGNLWRTDPQYLETEAGEALYQRSKPVTHLDVFISHSWASKGRRKVLSLLMQSGGNHALLFWFVGILTAGVLCYGDVLPMSFTYSPGTEKFNEDCPLGFWVMIFGLVGTLFGVMLSPYLPGCVRDTCFIDVASIHQADEALTRRGIRGIGGFLLISRELRILWSPVYLSRLWCVFEVATYKKINPNGRVVLAPIFLETIVIVLYVALLGASISYWIVRGAGYANYYLVGLLFACAPFLMFIQLLRKNYKQKHQLFTEFGSFDLDSVQCYSNSDRRFIRFAIAELYGSNEAFTSYVRGPLCEELLGPMTQSTGPEKYGLLIVSPILSMLMEFMLALLKKGAPSDVVLIYVMAFVIVGVFLFLQAGLKLLVLLCDRFAEPFVQRSAFFDYVQSFMIFLAFMLYFMLGGLLGFLPWLTSRWEPLPGIAIAFALMLLALNWLQRKSDRRRMMSKAASFGI